MKLRSKKGFSLVELIIVIAILGIIAVIAIPNLTGIQQRSQVNADIRTAEQIGKAARIWLTDTGLGSGRLEAVQNKWVRLDDESLTDFSNYISTTYVPKSYTANTGAYWIGAIQDSDNTSSHVFVAIGPVTAATAVSSTTVAYTKGTDEGVAYAEGYTSLADGVTALIAEADKLTGENVWSVDTKFTND